MIEEWKAIDGTNGMYEVSNTGKIRSNNYLGHGIVRELKSHHDQKGYLRTRIFKDNKRITIKLHRAVAIAFIPNPDNKPEVNHKDGNKENNNVYNLEWNTPKENTLHAYSHGLKENTREWCREMGKRNKGKDTMRRIRGTKLVAVNLETGDKLYFGSQAEASETLHIPQANISKVIQKKRKSAHGYTFYADKRG